MKAFYCRQTTEPLFFLFTGYFSNTLVLENVNIKREPENKMSFPSDDVILMEPTHFGRHVLVVEDVETTRFVMYKMLETLGITFDFADTGTEAVERVSEQAYGLIFLNIGLPELGGFEVARKMRSVHQESNSRLPIIALTSYDNEEVREKCLEAGMDDILVKPPVIDALKDILQTWLVKSGKPKESLWAGESEAGRTATSAHETGFLEELRARDPEKAEKLAGIAVKDLEERIYDMREAIENKDWQEAEAHAHAMKSVALDIGASEFAALARKMAALCYSENLEEDDFRWLADKMTSLFLQIRDALRDNQASKKHIG
jgi:CheY-like chemotaxis protein/HPt (histidine-containing phosphotransfer) domain-containing protein